MAMSFCSTWGSSIINPATEAELSTVDHHQLLAATELFGGDFYGHTDHIVFSSHFLDQQLAAEYENSDTNFANPIPYASDNLVSPAFDSYQYLKRRKSFEDCYATNVNVPCFVGGFNVLGSIPAPEFLPCAAPFQAPPCNGDESVKKSSVSAQSVAARQRRKRITEKTQELGKLVPGGSKMNTAEMFHAASKYVKWLQAQVSILQCMASEKPMETPELKILLGTPMIQEKLYSEEKCLVPKKFAQKLANDHDIQSKPWIVKDINLLLLPQIKD